MLKKMRDRLSISSLAAADASSIASSVEAQKVSQIGAIRVSAALALARASRHSALAAVSGDGARGGIGGTSMAGTGRTVSPAGGSGQESILSQPGLTTCKAFSHEFDGTQRDWGLLPGFFRPMVHIDEWAAQRAGCSCGCLV